MRTIIFVMGTGRCGTSFVTEGLTKLGASLGENVTIRPADAANEGGYFEAQEFIHFNDRITWNKIDADPLAMMSAGAEVVAGMFEEHFPDLDDGFDYIYVLKATNLCMLYGVYVAACARLGIQARVVICNRPHEEVILSAHRQIDLGIIEGSKDPGVLRSLFRDYELGMRHWRQLPYAEVEFSKMGERETWENIVEATGPDVLGAVDDIRWESISALYVPDRVHFKTVYDGQGVPAGVYTRPAKEAKLDDQEENNEGRAETSTEGDGPESTG